MTAAVSDRPSGAARTILVVDDEPSFAESLQIGLRREGYQVVVAGDGAQALECFDRVHPDLVLLDLMLPRLSGSDVCRELRRRSRIPIIVLTARSDEVDTVLSLELGADDYVTKPFRLRELVARIRAVLRRSQQQDDGARPLSVGAVHLDPATRDVTVDGRGVTLTRKEFDLLEELLRNAGRVQTRDHLLAVVWGSDYFGDTKTLDVHIKRLRTKLGAENLITTFRGVGYRFEPERAVRA
jgi:two-component system response regulator RegX3